ncbi:hypothetical protein [Pseudomonas prosekii]|uniref:hypothetical protein n=1 Tax=Pseudomonas prosekii TaxID=1148509 RepID=UPI0011EB2A4F|nr:hypothetical protein [Pseudomonas prosekii]
MTRPSKKLRERLFAEAASKGLGEAWSLEDISEPMDFIVHSGGEASFGLEIMELHDSPIDGGGSSLMEAQSKQQWNLREILKKYYDRGGRSVRVNFLGDLSDSQAIVDCLLRETKAAHIEEIIIETANVKMWVLPLPSDREEFDRYQRWRVADAGFVREIGASAVESAICKKARHLPEYLQKVSTVDLLLVVDRTTRGGRFTVPHNVTFTAGGFRRVVLLNYPIDAQIIASSSLGGDI